MNWRRIIMGIGWQDMVTVLAANGTLAARFLPAADGLPRTAE